MDEGADCEVNAGWQGRRTQTTISTGQGEWEGVTLIRACLPTLCYSQLPHRYTHHDFLLIEPHPFLHRLDIV